MYTIFLNDREGAVISDRAQERLIELHSLGGDEPCRGASPFHFVCTRARGHKGPHVAHMYEDFDEEELEPREDSGIIARAVWTDQYNRADADPIQELFDAMFGSLPSVDDMFGDLLGDE